MTGNHSGEPGGGVGGGIQRPELAPGISSMLRTSTEMGGVGGHGNDLSGFGVPLQHQRRGASSRMSTTSSVSNQSNYNHHNRKHRPIPSSSSAPRQSMPQHQHPPLVNVPYYGPDTMSPTMGNLTGSSPMLPIRPQDRNSEQRSLSMTHSVQPHDLRPSNNNRSMGSLRSHESAQRPSSPLAHPNRFGGPQPFRAASPAWAHQPGRDPRRLQTRIGSGPPQSSGAYPSGPYPSAPHPPSGYAHGPAPGFGSQKKHRIPSDASLVNSERSQHTTRRGPSRGPSPAYPVPYGDNVPPLPSLQQHYHPALEHTRMMNNNSVMGSASGSSINMRTDSDTPSSDLPQPPTPRDGMPIGQPYSRTKFAATTRVQRNEVSSEPFYYDGSEQFESDNFTNPGSDQISTGYVYPSKKHVASMTPPRTKGKSSIRTLPESKPVHMDHAAELPASPVPRRITRTLVKSVLEPFSTTDRIGLSDSASITNGNDSADHREQDQITAFPARVDSKTSATIPIGHDKSRRSVSSQVETSFLESSTVDLARDTFLPALTGTALVNDVADATKPAEVSTGSPEKSTDDGMSEFIGNYQHTDSKRQADVDTDADVVHESDVVAEESPIPKTGHAKTSSDDQSFKSCTDVLEHVAPIPIEEKAEEEEKRLGNNVDGQVSAKSSEVQSSGVCKDASAPSRQSLQAPSGMPPATLANLEPQAKTPASDVASSSPLRALYRKADSGLSHAAHRLRGGSKASVREGTVSNSGSSSTLNTARQPIVPPRESSASQEARRSNAVSGFLMRFKRAKSTVASDAVNPSISHGREISGPQFVGKNLLEPGRMEQQRQALLQMTGTVVDAPGLSSEKPSEKHESTQSLDMGTSSGALRVGLTKIPDYHQRALSSPFVGLPVASSVYSPQDISQKLRTHSSPVGLPLSPESSCRDSQSTTHLSWIGRRPFGNASASASEPHLPLPSVQEDTTTALRYSGYNRFSYAPQRYLPDLKEESHEDSSLNTSASNLKGSHFRFPFGGGLGMRTSVDDVVFLSRRSSTRSHRRSAAWEAHGLPCMEFSQANLYEKFKDALGDVRFSRSLDLPDVERGSPQRSVSAGNVLQGTIELVGSGEAFGVSREATQTAAVIDFAKLRRSYPPELMAEIDRLSIPSVTQLTQRCAELLPSLSLGEYYKQQDHGALAEFPEEEELMEHALESIHEVHPPPSQKRSSARLRPVRGASALMVVDDDVFEELTSKERGGPSAGVGEVERCGRHVGGVATRAPGQNNDLSHTPTRTLSPIAELQPPSPVVLRPRSNTAGALLLHSSAESTLSSRRSLRSPASTPTATVTRPWNFDEFYPWASTTHPAVDITLPPSAAAKSSPRPGPSHLRNTLSEASTSTFTSARTTTASRIGNATGYNTHRQSNRLSLFGRSGDQAHAVGERYPTSGKTFTHICT